MNVWIKAGAVFLFVACMLPFEMALIADDQGTSEDSSPSATTASDVDIELDQLRLMLKPLTSDELSVEADAWFALLRANAKLIAASQVGVKKTNVAVGAAGEDDSESKKELEEAAKLEEDAKQDAKQVESELVDADSDAGGKTPNSEKGDQEDASDEVAPGEPKGPGKSEDDPDGVATEEIVEQAQEKKDELLEDINELRTMQTALIDRLNLVLDEWENKGGDPAEYRAYASTVAGIEVDVTDASATYSAISGWLASEEGGWRWAKNILFFIAVILVAWAIALIVGAVLARFISRSRNISEMAKSFIVSFARRAVLLVGFIVALSKLEVDIGPLLAAIGAMGFIVGFALQGTLSNFASGLMILMYRPFDSGDLVEAGGVTGTVKEMNLVSTSFLTADNQMITVPNNAIWGSVIRNATANDNRRVDMVFGIGYDDDIQQAETILARILDEHELTLKDPAPIVKLHELADSSVNFVCRPWAKTGDYWTVYWDITRTVKLEFDKAGISIPYPQRDVHFHQANGEPLDAVSDASRRLTT